MDAKIISLGYAVPENSYTQEEIFNILQYPRQFKRIFMGAQIEKRHFWVPLNRIRHLTWQQQQEEYQRGAIALSKAAILNCLDGRSPKDIGCLVFCSCTGVVPGPTIGHYLIPEVGFKADIQIRNIQGMGCEGGGFPGLSTAIDYAIAHDKPAITVACELSSCTYFPEPDSKPDPENDYELLRANSIFADCASAALIGYDSDLKHPYIIGSENHTNTEYIRDLGYTWRDGRLRVLLSKKVPDCAGEVVFRAVAKLLHRHSLKVKDIAYWVIHAAGVKVLDIIRDELGIEEDKLSFSRQFLRDNGNVSSATVGGVAKLLIQEIEPKDDEYLVVVTVGPGITGGATLLQFGGE